MNTEQSCSLPAEQLTAWLLGELTPDEARAVEQHLATCASCRTELDELRFTLNLLREALQAEPLEETLRVDRRRALSRLRRPRGVPGAFLKSLAWAASILLTVGGFWWFRSEGPEPPAVTSTRTADPGIHDAAALHAAPVPEDRATPMVARRGGAAARQLAEEAAKEKQRESHRRGIADAESPSQTRTLAFQSLRKSAERAAGNGQATTGSSEVEKDRASPRAAAAEAQVVAAKLETDALHLEAERRLVDKLAVQTHDQPSTVAPTLARAAPPGAGAPAEAPSTSRRQIGLAATDGQIGPESKSGTLAHQTNLALGARVRSDRADVLSDTLQRLTDGQRDLSAAVRLPSPTHWIELELPSPGRVRALAVWYQPVGTARPIRSVELSGQPSFQPSRLVSVNETTDLEGQDQVRSVLEASGIRAQHVSVPATIARYVRVWLDERAGELPCVEIEVFGEPAAEESPSRSDRDFQESPKSSRSAGGG